MCSRFWRVLKIIMETLDVPLSQNFFSDEESSQVSDELWGRFLPMKANFKQYDLNRRELKFGRGEECDFTFCDIEKNTNKLLAYSKVHFILEREEMSTGNHTFLKDTSSNGTFINCVKVGKNMKQVLNNNDEISLVADKNKAFIYIDLECKSNDRYPDEIGENYTVSKVLGRGACGEVRMIFDKNDNCQPYAMKIIAKKKFSFGGTLLKDGSSQVQNEVNIMKNLNHPCIVETKNVIDTSDNLYIILELVEGGELFDRVIKVKQLKESTAKLIFYQIILAVQYLHSQGITHRDLKAENVLLMNDDEETLVKVTDFGLSKLVNSATVMQTLCGTPTYLAPEVLVSAGKGSYTNAIDCWSLGVILFVCLGGYPPFSDDYPGNKSLTQQIKAGTYSFPNVKWKNISVEAMDLIKKFLTVDPNERITIGEALKHEWLQDEKMIKKATALISQQEVQIPDEITVKRTRRNFIEDDTIMEAKKVKILTN